MNQTADNRMVYHNTRLRDVGGRRLLAGRSQAWEAAPESVASIRLFGTHLMTRWGAPSESVWAACEVMSELATNAIVHAQRKSQRMYGNLTAESLIWVSWLLFERTIRVEVEDDSAEIPRPAIAGDDDETGRGLRLVEAFCDTWGCEVFVDGGKRVWGELTC